MIIDSQSVSEDHFIDLTQRGVDQSIENFLQKSQNVTTSDYLELSGELRKLISIKS